MFFHSHLAPCENHHIYEFVLRRLLPLLILMFQHSGQFVKSFSFIIRMTVIFFEHRPCEVWTLNMWRKVAANWKKNRFRSNFWTSSCEYFISIWKAHLKSPAKSENNLDWVAQTLLRFKPIELNFNSVSDTSANRETEWNCCTGNRPIAESRRTLNHVSCWALYIGKSLSPSRSCLFFFVRLFLLSFLMNSVCVTIKLILRIQTMVGKLDCFTVRDRRTSPGEPNFLNRTIFHGFRFTPFTCVAYYAVEKPSRGTFQSVFVGRWFYSITSDPKSVVRIPSGITNSDNAGKRSTTCGCVNFCAGGTWNAGSHINCQFKIRMSCFSNAVRVNFKVTTFLYFAETF